MHLCSTDRKWSLSGRDNLREQTPGKDSTGKRTQINEDIRSVHGITVGCPRFIPAKQRAKRTCSHVHLATAARVKYPDACIGVFDCLWVLGDYKGKGYGKALMEYCLNDAGKMGRSGVCMLGATKQKAWLSDQSFAKKFGFETVDRTENGYELLARSFDGTVPAFSPNAKKMKIEQEELTIYYDQQCPYTYQSIESVKQYCASNHVPVSFFLVDTLQKAKELPCVFNNWAVFYKGRFETVNLLDAAALKRILKK